MQTEVLKVLQRFFGYTGESKFLHWEEIEKIVAGKNYYLEVRKLHNIPNCLVLENHDWSRVIVDVQGDTRQDVVEKAIIGLGKELDKRDTTVST